MAKAKLRPLMITADRAAEVLLGVISHGPAVKTYPLAMEVLISVAGGCDDSARPFPVIIEPLSMAAVVRKHHKLLS
jgi:hypothetical protein